MPAPGIEVETGSPAVGPPVLQVAPWLAIQGLIHGFFGRRGGVSVGDLSTLNLSDRVGDSPAALKANWSIVARSLPGCEIVRMNQVHGARVAAARAGDRLLPDTDGLMTAEPGLCLSTLTADCVPILMVAPAARAVMALHAGWRGTVAGISHAALDAGRFDLGVEPAQWRVAFGPAIRGCCYEVESDVVRRIEKRWGAMPKAWRASGERGKLDLGAVNRRILTAAGVLPENVVEIGPCTACAPGEYFSHRASGGRTGRQLSFIGWSRDPGASS
jgi:YfiH family protein